jgi:hypothetical protein
MIKKKAGQKIEKEKKNGKKTKIGFGVWSIWMLVGVGISLIRGEPFFKDFYYFVCFILVPPFFLFPVLRKSVVEYISNNIF